MTITSEKVLKKTMLMALIIAVACALWPMSSSAAESRKCYTISSGNTTVYSNTGLTKKYGTIFGSDELKVSKVTDRYSKVTYPIANGKTKTGYVKTSAILLNTTGKTYASKAKITTYKRPGGASYGYVSKGDKATILGDKGKYTQIKYPAGGGYKYAFVTKNNANQYIRGKTNDNDSTGSTKPSGISSLKGYRVTYPVPTKCKFSKKTKDGNWYGYHDINRNVSTKTPVYAIADGTATYKQAARNGYLTSYGNFIDFKSANGKFSAKYCHLSRFVGATQKIKSSRTKRKSGSTNVYKLKTKKVKRGELIGYIGKTGNASGVHLHFELRGFGTRIDPTIVFPKLK